MMKMYYKLLVLMLCAGCAMESMAAEGAGGTVALFDSVTPVDGSDTMATLVKDGVWTRITEDAVPSGFKGDAVFVNATLAAVIRKDGNGVDVYAKASNGWNRRARAVAVADGVVCKFGLIKPLFDDGAVVDVQVNGVKGGSVRFGMHMIHPLLEATATGPVDALRVMAPCRFGIMPDFFTADMMIDARKIPIDSTEIPSENILLRMVGNGNAIVASLWEKNERDIKVSFSGAGDARVMDTTDIFFGSDGGSVWTAVLEYPGVWHMRDFVPKEDIKKVTITDWAVPFYAKWKGNFTREDGNLESMKFTMKDGLKRRDNEIRVTVTSLLRNEASTMNFPQYKWYVGLQGPAVFYPSRRDAKTPLNRLCVDDLLREGLGTGPCEGVLDGKSQEEWSKGIFTCSYRRMVDHLCAESVVRQREVIARIKDERYFVRRINRNVMTFVRNVQDRINVYADFGADLMVYLDEQEKEHPELSASMKKIRSEWNLSVKVLHGERTLKDHQDTNERLEANVAPAEKMLVDFNKLLYVDTLHQFEKGSKAGAVADLVGEAGDSRLRNMRRKVMMIRGIAMMETAVNPGFSGVAKEIRKRSEVVLRNPHSYERATKWQ